MTLKYTGKQEPPDAEATAELLAAVRDKTITFAVIETAKGRVIYTNIEEDDARELFGWLLGGVLEGLLLDLGPKAGRIQ